MKWLKNRTFKANADLCWADMEQENSQKWMDWQNLKTQMARKTNHMKIISL